MSACDFLHSLGARGLSLFVQEGRVVVTPGILLTKDDWLNLWRHEKALVALLKLREAAAAYEHPACPGVVQISAKVRQLHSAAEKLVGEALTFDGRRRREWA